ncbi:Uncharacterised protein [Chlamydia trachomatis]|nr:Uncharacterised protein [Chlamydia trachomatis]
MLVSHDWNSLVDDWQDNVLTNQVLVARVFWIDSDSHIPKHGLWTSGSDFQSTRAIFQHVIHMVKGTFHVLVDNLDIRQSRTSRWVPVDDKLTAVNPSFFVKVNKYLANSLRQALI